MKAEIRIFLLDDHAIFRTGLKQVFADEQDIQVIGEAATAEEGIGLIEKLYPFDVLLLDISLPDQNGLEVLARLKTAYPELPVLLLSTYPEDQYAIRGLRLGAAGYLTKDCHPNLLVGGIRRVASGKRLLSDEITERLIGETSFKHHQPVHTTLSSRELEVFKAIAQGKSPSEMAESMQLSVKTIATYRARIMEKMGMTKTNEIMLYAIDQHLL